MVQEAMTYIDQITDLPIKTALIETLSTVTAGKIYVEVERARLVRQLAKIKEASGDIDAAAEAMQEVAVETFGAMAKTEKVAFILEQVRLCLDKKDFVRASILSKKVSSRTFKEREPPKEGAKKRVIVDQAMMEQPAMDGTPTLAELKLMYYALCVRIYIHNADYLEVCRCYQAVFEDKAILEDAARWAPVLKKICWYAVLAPHGVEQQTMLHAVFAEKKLTDVPAYHALLKLFTTLEVIRWPVLQSSYGAEMAAQTDVFGGAAAAKRMEDLNQRVVEHNILVIRKYYSRVTLTRLAELLNLELAATEKALAEMVVSKTVTAKIDRPAGVVDFVGKKDASELLNSWAGNIQRVLTLVDQSCHKIHKECMQHKIPLGSS